MLIAAPQLLIAFRAFCAPLIFVLACFGFPGPLLAAVLGAAFLSDVFDGVVARRLGTATPGLRYADTLVDTVFYVAAAAAVWVAVPGVFDGAGLLLIALVIVHVSRATFELTKYGRVASYHMWSSRLLGVTLAVGLAHAFIAARPSPILLSAVWLAIANELEGFAASTVLPDWRTDVPSLVHAVRGAGK